MSHDQLAAVFPNGRTVHIPADGNPLKGYDLAAADIERREKNGDVTSSRGSKGFLASLFSSKSNNDEEDEAPANEVAPKDQKVAQAAQPAKGEARSAAARAPAGRLSGRVRRRPGPAKRPATDGRPQTVADIINARGFWGDDVAKPTQASPAQVAALAARAAVGDPQATASVTARDRPGARLRAADRPARPQQDRRRQRADPAQHPAAECRRKPDGGQHRRHEGRAAGADADHPRRRRQARDRRLDAGDGAGAEQLPLHAGDRDRRAGHDGDAHPFRQAGGGDRCGVRRRRHARDFAPTASPDRPLRPCPRCRSGCRRRRCAKRVSRHALAHSRSKNGVASLAYGRAVRRSIDDPAPYSIPSACM